MDVYLQGKRTRLDPSASIGKGGEADVFDLGGGQVLKVFKTEDHPDYEGMPAEQDAARQRLLVHQTKLRAFPSGLPERVIAPQELATDRSGKKVVGYTMPLVAGAEVLMRCGDPALRKAGLTGARVARILADLHRTVAALHVRGVVVGDFNDLNVLVQGDEARMIDADSFQFGSFLCRMFTERFVDPLLCDAAAPRPLLTRPFSTSSDWYAFAVMVMQTLLCVGPYGGVFKPANKSERVPEATRPLRRITVFRSAVVYPKPAIPYGVLPDDLLHELYRIFEQDSRGQFPRRLLDELAWTRCASCGLEHARAVCPACVGASAPVQAITVVRGNVTCRIVLETRGTLVAAAVEGGDLLWLVHEGGEFRREDGAVVMTGALDSFLSFALQGKTTFVGRGAEIVALTPGERPERFTVDACSGRPAFAVTASHRYFAQSGRLLREAALSDDALLGSRTREHVGDVLTGQTLFWASDSLGFGFYRAGDLSVAFVFDPARRGLNDTVKLPFLPGRLTAADCVLGRDRAWVFLALQCQRRTVHRCTVVGAGGAVLASAEADAGDGSWLGTLQGKCAVGEALLSATDAGIVRVEARGGAIVETRQFPETEPFVTASSALFAAQGSLFVTGPRGIKSLRIA